MLFAGKTLAAAAAAAIAAFALLIGSTLTTANEKTLGAALDHTAQAKSLQLKVVQAGSEADVWVTGSGAVRWEDSPARYRVATGTRLWEVDEENNRVVETPNRWRQADAEQVDLLALLADGKLGLSEEAEEKVRAAEPVGQAEHAGRTCRVYRLNITRDKQPLEVEAFVDAETGMLFTIAAWPGGKTPRPPLPLAELRLVARDVPVDETKFVVAKSLSADGRLGKVTDVQGTVGLRPALFRRWTPVCGPLLLKPGDWLRTDMRGANAAEVVLTSEFKVIAGPGALLEFNGANRIKLLAGEARFSGEGVKGSTLELTGPAGQALTVAAGQTVHYRVIDHQQLFKVEKEPLWLAGFLGATSNESIGSLIANIDGRNLPLTVGFHRVKVEIRDQIARTTIEESFVNHTGSRLEGIFHFPLPQDASISGFGMWINGELIEADVVEKQRAREIYETILREKRDPGLLEWTGGNIFKARVFPIEAHSEKRIRIVYTQVLPLRANRYRYSYGLRSEMLQKTPLRELSLEVLINSALPLKKVESPTHAVRTNISEHSAKLDFAAQEYTPDRDFEVVCEVDPQQSSVVMIPHRRGDDGYFLVQLTPPSGEGDWQREMLPNGDPLELLLVCDTSGSIDTASRARQAEFVSAMLNSLAPQDRYNIAVCDVDCHWLFEDFQESNEKTRAQTSAWLDKRVSLGWTNLDNMAQSVRQKIGKHTHVVYIGDGVVTSRDANPQAFAQRWQLEMRGQPKQDASQATFHAVSLGSSFESVVLRAIAAIGGGSVRQIDGEQTPQKVAFELLNEVAQPGIRDLQMEFKGLQVAAVYPDRLPNLSAGTQQILIGRYLPPVDEQPGPKEQGEIVITGRRGGETVRYAARIVLDHAESGNSFIPRLWARSHLDHLLAQGSNSFIRDEIISLSEEFHIITPYTSLLVLETDADRERFGVKRRYEMRDGERFFAEGRSNANFELLQQQMKLAGDWRLGMRYQVLKQLAMLGRNKQQFDWAVQQVQQIGQSQLSSWSGFEIHEITKHANPLDGEWGQLSGLGLAGSGGGFGGGGAFFGDEPYTRHREESGVFWDYQLDHDGMDDTGAATMPSSAPVEALEDLSLLIPDMNKDLSFRADLFERLDGERRALPSPETELMGGWLNFANDRAYTGYFERTSLGPAMGGGMGGGMGAGFGWFKRSGQQSYSIWLETLFPAVPVPTAPGVALESPWPAEAVEISQRVMQPLNLGTSGLDITQVNESHDPNWNRLTSKTTSTQLYATARWHTHSIGQSGASGQVQWCDGKQRGVYATAFQLGRVRRAIPRDLTEVEVGQRAFAQHPLHETYRNYDVSIQRPQANRVLLVLKYPKETPTNETQITIDTERNVILKIENHYKGKLRSTVAYEDYKRVGETWWPAQIIHRDSEERLTSRTSQEVKLLDEKAFAARYEKAQAPLTEVQLLQMPLPSLAAAEKSAQDGSADFADRLVLLQRAASIQKWETVFAEFDEMVKLAGDNKPGMNWIRIALQIASRRNAEAQELLGRAAEKLVENESPDDQYLADYVLNSAQQIADYNEQMRLLAQLRPVFVRQAAPVDGVYRWKDRQAQLLANLGRNDELLAIRKELAESAPWAIWAQYHYAQLLVNRGDIDEGLAWLRQEIARPEHGTGGPNQLWDYLTQVLYQQGRYVEWVSTLEERMKTRKTDTSLYQQYLGGLVYSDREEDAEATASRWLQEGRIEGDLSLEIKARLNAAIDFGLGKRYHDRLNWIVPGWRKPLLETARFYLDRPNDLDVPRRILGEHYFRETDEADQLLADIAERLRKNVDTAEDELLIAYVDWTIYTKLLTQAEWKRVAAEVRQRWQQEDQDMNHQIRLGESLVRIYQQHFFDSEYFPFLRARIARAKQKQQPDHVAQFTNNLFQALLGGNWSEQHEIESLNLLLEISNSSDAALRRMAQISALYQWVDQMIATRVAADRQKLQDQGHPEDLTRTELAQRYADFQTAAQTAVAKRLASTKLGANQDLTEDQTADAEQLQRWMQMERMYLDVQLSRNFEQIAAACWKLLGDAPVEDPEIELETPDPLDPEAVLAAEVKNNEKLAELRQFGLEQLLRQRAFATVANLAARRNASQQSVQRVLDYIDAGIEQEGTAAGNWKQARFQLLIALDRPDDLERNLRAWIKSDDYVVPWQRALARLLAERGELAPAIAIYEAIEKGSQLSPTDYGVLSNWYLVVDQREAYEQAKKKTFNAMQEWQIQNWISSHRQRWSRTDVPLPTELDESVLLAFEVLFEKSANPENYIYELGQFYAACRDFRLLQMVPDATLGRTPQQIYNLLGSVHRSLLREVRNEATSDEIMARLNEIRPQRNTPIDGRALDLLEMLVESRAAQVLNQPGPHTEAGLAAMKRAFQREWASGEVRQMAEFLNSLGTLPQRELNDERFRELRVLQSKTKPGTDDHLYVTYYLASALDSGGQRPEAIPLLEIAIRRYEQTHPEGWPEHANSILSSYVRMLQTERRWLAAENVLNHFLEKPANTQQRWWLEEQRTQLYLSALQSNGTVSLGTGETLYHNLFKDLLEEVRKRPDQRRYQIFDQLMNLISTANSKKYEACHEDLRRIAFEDFDKLLKNQINQFSSFVERTADMLHYVNEVEQALEFLLIRVENYPPRLEYSNNNAWRQFGGRLAKWRAEGKEKIARLEPRLLKLTLAELQRDLETRHQQDRHMYHDNHSYFWAEKRNDFSRVAEEVLKRHQGSARSVKYIAEYIYQGLERHDRAIEILLIAHGKGMLDDSTKILLCRWLRNQDRYAETIAILEPMIKENPDTIYYRTLLMEAYHQTLRKQQLQELLTATDAHFRQKGRWTEENIAGLAKGCLNISRYREAVGYYDEVIQLHQRTQPNRGIGNGTLSDYYMDLAQAYSNLEETVKAVDAAAAGVVAWGPRENERQYAISRLENVLYQAPDLDKYVAHLDREAAETGQDSPLIRRQVGKVYLDKNEYEKAARQLEVALQLQPYDVETQQALITAYDKLGEQDKAVQQVLAQIDFDRHNLDLYRDLYQRAKSDDNLAERAATSIVEAAPLEPAHRTALAEIREQQNRWGDAIEQWQEVAKLQALEPTGLIHLATAQIHEKQWKDAQSTLDKLQKTPWPDRFSNVQETIRQLQSQIKP